MIETIRKAKKYVVKIRDTIIENTKLLPENYEAFAIFSLMMLVLAFGAPAVSNAFNNPLIESSEVSFEYNYRMGNLTSQTINFECEPVRKYLISGRDAYKCRYYTEDSLNVIDQTRDVPRYRLIEFVWLNENSNSSFTQPIFDISNLFTKNILPMIKAMPDNENNTLYLEAPPDSGIYYLGPRIANHSKTQHVFNEIGGGNRSFSSSIDSEVTGQRVYNPSRLDDIRKSDFSEFTKVFVVLSSLFGGTTLILRLNSLKESNKARRYKCKKLSFYLLLIIIAYIALRLSPLKLIVLGFRIF